MKSDKAGVVFKPMTNGPVTDGTKAIIRTSDGPVKGTIRSDYFVPDKKKP